MHKTYVCTNFNIHMYMHIVYVHTYVHTYFMPTYPHLHVTQPHIYVHVDTPPHVHMRPQHEQEHCHNIRTYRLACLTADKVAHIGVVCGQVVLDPLHVGPLVFTGGELHLP